MPKSITPLERSISFQQEMFEKMSNMEKIIDNLTEIISSLDKQNDSLMILLSTLGEVLINKKILTEDELKAMTQKTYTLYEKEKERIINDIAVKRTNEFLSNMLLNGKHGNA